MDSSPDNGFPPKFNPDGTPYNFGIAGKPLNPTLDAQGHAYDALKASQEKAAPLPKPDFQESVDELHNKNPLQTLRTFESDAADAVKSKGATSVKIAIAQEKQREEQARPKAARTFFMTIFSIVFIVAGVGVIGVLGAAYAIKWRQKPAIIVQSGPTILHTDSEQELLLPPNTTIAASIADQHFVPQGAQNSLVGLSIVASGTASNTPLDAATFATRLPSNIPSLVSLSLEPYFVVGYQLLDTPQPFIIFKTSSYDNSFAGMLSWEKTLSADISNLMIAGPQSAPAPAAAASSTGSTASSTDNISPGESSSAPVVQTFQDSVIDNTNVRILDNADGTPIVVYALPDQSTIVITTNEATMKEILTRLKATVFVQ